MFGALQTGGARAEFVVGSLSIAFELVDLASAASKGRIEARVFAALASQAMEILEDVGGQLMIDAEDGSNDPKVDWVTPFEKQTGCKANVKYFGTSDEAVNLMKSGGYDVVSASGDASLRLVASGLVAPVNTALIKDYGQIEPFLKNRAWNSVNGQIAVAI